jgi:hypothetical protein
LPFLPCFLLFRGVFLIFCVQMGAELSTISIFLVCITAVYAQ